MREAVQLSLNGPAKHNIETNNVMPAESKTRAGKISKPEFVKVIDKIRSEYRCFCGKLFSARVTNVSYGGTKSCGCLRSLSHIKHGHSRSTGHSRTYQCWQNMRRRCCDPNHPRYKDYGGRGITVFQKWYDSFEAFLNDVGECPDGMTIERIENNLGYQPGNVKWIPLAEQSRNRRCVKIYTVRGASGPIKALCEQFGAPYGSTRLRIEQGWEAEAAMFTPRLGKAGYVPHGTTEAVVFTVQNVIGSLKFLCRHFGRPYVTARRRIGRGWAAEEAMFTPPDPNKQRYVNNLKNMKL